MSQITNHGNIENILREVRFSPSHDFRRSLWKRLLVIESDMNLVSENTSHSNKANRKVAKRLSQLGLHFRYRKVIIVSTVFLLLFVLCAGIPNIRYALQELVQRASLVLYDSPQIEDTTVAQAEIESHVTLISLEEAQRHVPIPIPQLTWLPEKLSLLGVYLYEQDDDFGASQDKDLSFRLALSYGYEDLPEAHEATRLTLAIVSGLEDIGALVPEQYVEEIQVEEKVIYYVKGSWEATGEGLQWDPSIDIIIASWTDESITYEMIVHDLSLTREEVLKIIQSIQ